MKPHTAPTAAAIRSAYSLALVGYFALIAGIYLWHLAIHKTADHQISLILLIQLGPLIFPLRGLLSGKIYTHAWSMYLAILYFVIGVWYSSAAATLYFGLYLVATSLLFLAGTMLYTRWASHAEKSVQTG